MLRSAPQKQVIYSSDHKAVKIFVKGRGFRVTALAKNNDLQKSYFCRVPKTGWFSSKYSALLVLNANLEIIQKKNKYNAIISYGC